MVIVNPNSGPGNTSTPNEQYTSQILRLNAVSNVRTVGYVRTGYASRSIDDVLADVQTYSGWASANSNLSMHGIFLDESPHQYSVAAASYMRNVTQTIKNANGISSPKLVIRNPGTIEDSVYNDTNTDVVVFFESDYTSYQASTSTLKAHDKDRSGYAAMVNSVPTMSQGDLRSFVKGVSQLAKYLFVTDNTQDYYESFGSDWSDFTSVVPA